MAAKKKAKKQKAKKQPAKKQPAKKQPAKKQPPKKAAEKAPHNRYVRMKLRTSVLPSSMQATAIMFGFENIPTAGVTLTQISGETFPLCQPAQFSGP